MTGHSRASSSQYQQCRPLIQVQKPLQRPRQVASPPPSWPMPNKACPAVTSGNNCLAFLGRQKQLPRHLSCGADITNQVGGAVSGLTTYVDGSGSLSLPTLYAQAKKLPQNFLLAQCFPFDRNYPTNNLFLKKSLFLPLQMEVKAASFR